MILPTEDPALLVTARSLLACGKTVGIFGWSTARTIGSTFGRIFFSGTESRLPRQTPSPLAQLSIAAFGPGAISAAKSMFISPQKCSGSSKSLLSHSLHIRYFAMRKRTHSHHSRRPRMALRLMNLLAHAAASHSTKQKPPNPFSFTSTGAGWSSAAKVCLAILANLSPEW